MDSKWEQATALLAQHGQEQLLQFYPQLSAASQAKLVDTILNLDFNKINNMLNNRPTAADHMEALDSIHAWDWDEFDVLEQEQFTQKGWELLRKGKVGALVVAGGQGSRLGHEGPKGTYDIGLPSHKSLFQLQAERLINLSKRAGTAIPWYVMTSPDNHRETVHFFNNHDFFGYAQEDCFFFEQGVMPALDESGKILMAAEDEISLAPSGNGDCFAALKRSGALDDLKRRGVEWLFYYNVDNALIKVADPVFIGVASHFNNPVATKVIEKVEPEEKVGVVCLKNGHPAVVEYNELPESIMYDRDDQGKLKYRLANLSIQLFRTDFIEKHAQTEIPYHVAHKKIPYVNSEGALTAPDKPNAYKFERHHFDFFPLADNLTVLLMKRDAEFAPVKNKEGVDSPFTARKMLFELHRSWLLAAGVPPERLATREIEVSPLVSYAGEGLDPLGVNF
ncbi:UDPGP type 1 family protein [Paenibacillus radicis (ex Xue et al. 2023)]|uniref:UDPGP type 1 family protein n=1 Tax=Paenibacillus radicis (ex Xue et al. 2023) TaxID=2972489 RepID=A0ABT1YTK5_9BACL|nr:UDPGP type 1 family protein [Paenibacillus radicis (ex Xue et al. 2023)]MCR8636513.1 UDPGP type 1 family protein [Paenibacillus radicis (ex Xue et al. 2023)]